MVRGINGCIRCLYSKELGILGPDDVCVGIEFINEQGKREEGWYVTDYREVVSDEGCGVEVRGDKELKKGLVKIVIEKIEKAKDRARIIVLDACEWRFNKYWVPLSSVVGAPN